MKKLAYLDCPTGIAGDMCLGALVHAGVPLTYLIETLERLGIGDEYELQAEAVRRNGQAAIKIHVHLLAVRTESDAPDLAAPIMNPASTVKVSPPAPRHDHSDCHFGVTADSKSALASAHPLTQPAELPASAPPHRPTRHLPEIEHLILEANLPAKATAWSLAV
ncbi:MAG: DUF111 family protein, partial [Pseudanabaenales cyanobacterium]|nr:DUF111 family protein [Pseudanabaenales cyanobacterium]